MNDLSRALAFDRRMIERLATDVIPFPYGVAYLDAEFPKRYDSNLLWVDRVDGVPAERLAAEADRILGGAGLDHRKIEFGDLSVPDGLAVGFADLGYAIERTVVFVLRREADRAHDLAAIREVSFDDVRELELQVARREPWGGDESVVRMLTDHHGKLAHVFGARFFAAFADGRPVGCCELYLEGDEAQIESVDTLEEYRGRGFASAFVLRAAAEARAAGATWIHLWADGDDWPQHWYRTLGFDEVGRMWSALRAPPAA